MIDGLNKIIIAGMPNAGKSTVFNGLTNGNAKVGNWHGVTTSVLEKRAKILGNEFLVKDLPGAYSLTPATLEEKKAINEIISSKDLILYVIEGATLPKALTNVIELLKRGKKVIVAVNMVKELLRRGGFINFNKLEKMLGCPVVYGEFNTRKGLEKIKKAVSDYDVKLSSVNEQVLKDISLIYRAPAYAQGWLDKLTLNAYTAIPIFLCAVFITFYLAFGKFGLGSLLSGILNSWLDGVTDSVMQYLTDNGCNEFLKNVAVSGVLQALSGVFSFLPQTLIIFSALVFLEESGYASRLACVSEKLLSKTGLNGRAVFSIFMGLGCTALSVASSGGLENNASRKRVTVLSAFVPCSAKIPVISYLSTFVKYPFLFTISIYAIGVILALIETLILSKALGEEKRLPLVIELPPYRIPTIKNYLKSLLNNLKGFIIRICTVIFIISLAVSLLSLVTTTFEYSYGNYDKSILFAVGNAFKFLTYPMGINDGRIASSLLAGIFAKEGVLSTFITLYPNGLTLSFASLTALTFFIYAYTPCITAMSVVYTEIGKKFTVKFAVFQFIIPLLTSYFIYYFIKFNVVKWVTVALILTVIILKITIKRKR